MLLVLSIGTDVHVFEGGNEDIAEGDDLFRKAYVSIYEIGTLLAQGTTTYVFVLEVFQKFEFSIRSFRKNRCAEWLHNLLDGYILVCELVAGRAICEKW